MERKDGGAAAYAEIRRPIPGKHLRDILNSSINALREEGRSSDKCSFWVKKHRFFSKEKISTKVEMKKSSENIDCPEEVRGKERYKLCYVITMSSTIEKMKRKKGSIKRVAVESSEAYEKIVLPLQGGAFVIVGKGKGREVEYLDNSAEELMSLADNIKKHTQEELERRDMEEDERQRRYARVSNGQPPEERFRWL